METLQRSVDALLDDYLRAMENQLPDVDRSAGTLAHILGSAVASCNWGIYSRLDFLARQILPDTAESARLDRHANVRGLTRTTGQTDSSLLTDLLSVLRNPPAGGNKFDWVRWAKEAVNGTELCSNAWLDENARGLGTVNVGIASDTSEDPADHSAWANGTTYAVGAMVSDDSVTGSDRVYVATSGGTSSGTGVADDYGVTWEDAEEYASPELVTEAVAYLEGRRPVGIWDYEVYPVLKKVQAVSMTVTGDDLNLTTIAEQIESFMKGLVGGKGLYVAQLVYVAIDAGAENATVVTPAADVAVTWGPTSYQRIWPGQITVSE